MQIKEMFSILLELIELFPKILIFNYNLYHDDKFNFIYKGLPQLLITNC